MRFLPLVAMVLLLALPSLAWGQQLNDLPSPYPYPEASWSPYVVGALIGILTLATLTISKKAVGASSAYADLAGLGARTVAPEHVASLPYFKEHKPAINWSLLFVVGAVLGAFLAAWWGGELTGTFLQDMWVMRFGEHSHVLRTVVAFAGGALMAYGARMAGGCTSGHGISGTLQLSVGSWIAVLCFFVGGIAVALPLYRW